MSNNTNDKNILLFEFLSSKQFIQELQDKNFAPEEHNLLLSAHLLAIGFNTSGINEGSVNVKYSKEIAPIKEDFWRAKSNFAFYTTKNGLIEDSNYFNRQSIRFNHPMFCFKDTRGFRDFCVEYFNKNSKVINSDYSIEKGIKLDNKIIFRLNGKRRNSIEGQLYGYESIICSNLNVRSLLESWILEKELVKNNEVKIKKLKL
jgi:hypothetical protein